MGKKGREGKKCSISSFKSNYIHKKSPPGNREGELLAFLKKELKNTFAWAALIHIYMTVYPAIK